MGKLTAKQVFTYVAILCVLILVAVYFLVYKKYTDLATSTENSNIALAQRVNDLKVYYDNEAKYLADMVPLKEEIKVILDKYPSAIQEEDVIMHAVHTQLIVPITYTSVAIGEKNILKTITSDVVVAAGMEEYQNDIIFVEQSGTYPNTITYDNLKIAIQSIFDSEYSIGIKNIVYSKGEEDLNGTLDLVFYSVQGNGKEYKLPEILPYVSGTANFFNNTVTEE